MTLYNECREQNRGNSPPNEQICWVFVHFNENIYKIRHIQNSPLHLFGDVYLDSYSSKIVEP